MAICDRAMTLGPTVPATAAIATGVLHRRHASMTITGDRAKPGLVLRGGPAIDGPPH